MARPDAPHFTSAPPAAGLAQAEGFALPDAVPGQDLSGVIPDLPEAAMGGGGPYEAADFLLADLPGQAPIDLPPDMPPEDVPVADPGMPADLPLIPFASFACELADEAGDALADNPAIDFDLWCG